MGSLKIIFLSIATFVFMLSPKVGATEVDNFTQRYNKIEDSKDAINGLTNQFLEKALAKVNLRRGCGKHSLYQGLHEALGGFLWSRLEEALEKSHTIDKEYVPRSKSLYRHLNVFQSFALYMADLGSVVKMDHLLVGTDKIGHFLDTGYLYFEMAYLKGKGENAAMRWGESTERGYFGLMTTGVWSYGDLVANYNGMRFWQKLIKDDEDEDNDNPYIICEDEHWKLVRPFDWMAYMDQGWDEAINCSRYRTAGIRSSVNTYLAKLEEKTGEKFRCPVEPGACAGLLEKYGELSDRLITPLCKEAALGAIAP